MFMCSLVLYLFLVVKCVSAIQFVPKEKLNQTLQVEIANGVIQGIEKRSVLGTSYFRYMGIPYARPPVKNLRFRGPKPMTKWSGVLDASVAASCCGGFNLSSIFKLEFALEGDEDCLYLNIYSPKKPNLKNHLPIMMYIFGGGFISGCGNKYEADYLIEHDVILVIPNYRISIFGYLSTGDMECPGNWAIKDLIAVLKWIQINIQKFGGDPRRVTLFGHSSGAANINMILMSPKAQGLFHGAILMSGSSLSYWAYQTEPKRVAFDVGLTLGIETNSTKHLIEELRKVEFKDLLKGQIPAIIWNFLSVMTNGLPFTPTIEPPHKNAVWSQPTNYPYYLLEQGKFNKVPLMVGTTTMEMIIFLPVLDMSPSFLIRLTNDNQNRSIVGNKVKDYFLPTKSYATASKEDILRLLSGDSYWRPLRKLSSFISKFKPVYFFQFSYEGQVGLNTIKITSGTFNRSVIRGVSHGEELGYLFNHDGYRRNKDDFQMTKKLTRLFTNFAKTGNPTPVVDPGLDNVSWPSIRNEKEFPYLDIGQKLKVGDTSFYEESYEFWNSLYQTYGQKPYKVY